MKLREVKIEEINNTVIVEGKTVTCPKQAAEAAFRAGAEEMATMFRDALLNSGEHGLFHLMVAASTESFYQNQ